MAHKKLHTNLSTLDKYQVTHKVVKNKNLYCLHGFVRIMDIKGFINTNSILKH